MVTSTKCRVSKTSRPKNVTSTKGHVDKVSHSHRKWIKEFLMTYQILFWQSPLGLLSEKLLVCVKIHALGGKTISTVERVSKGASCIKKCCTDWKPYKVLKRFTLSSAVYKIMFSLTALIFSFDPLPFWCTRTPLHVFHYVSCHK